MVTHGSGAVDALLTAVSGVEHLVSVGRVLLALGSKSRCTA